MSWSEDTIWWHCYPLGFVDAEPEYSPQVRHRLSRLGNWLDHVVDLGADGLLLAPIFASASHGYDTLDHFRIDPRLGDEGDFDDLVRDAKQRGIRVVLDGVFNHVSRDHRLVQRALAADPYSEERAWLKWVGGHPRVFEGNPDLVELNLAHRPVQDYVVRVMSHWLDRGVDGWRLDAAYAAGAEAWRPIVSRVRAGHPDCWILGEVIHGDYTDFVTRSGVDSVTQYELWKAIWSSLNDPNFHELAWTLARHDRACATFRPQTFIGNHDVSRIATTLTDPRHAARAAARLILLPGGPSIYAGDEQGLTGEKLHQPGGDAAVRPAFPAHPGELAGNARATFGEYQRVIDLRRRNPWLGGATATPSTVATGTIAIDLTSGGQRLTLALNATDETVRVPAGGGALAVAPHDWAVG